MLKSLPAVALGRICSCASAPAARQFPCPSRCTPAPPVPTLVTQAIHVPIPLTPAVSLSRLCCPSSTRAHPLCLSRNSAHTSLLQQYLPHPLCPSITVPNVFALAGAHPDTPAVPAPTLRRSQPCTKVVLLCDVCLSEVSSWLDIIETKAAHIVSAGWVRPPARGRETHQPGGAPACRPAVLQWRRCHRVTTSSLKLRCTCCVSS